VVAHINSIEADLAGHARPQHELNFAALPHVNDNPFNKAIEVGVDVRRGWAPAQLREENAAVTAERRPQIEALPTIPGTVVTGPLGLERPVERFVRIRAFDVYEHEHDIRRAVGRTEPMTGPGMAAMRSTMRLSWPLILAKGAEAPPGTTVRWQVTGAAGFHDTATVDADGRGRIVEDSVPTDLRLVMDGDTLALLAAGRIEPVDANVGVEGDVDLAGRVLAAMAVTP
jgi:hypothetical protein